jgi:archaellum biogenesis ATPase FlaH
MKQKRDYGLILSLGIIIAVGSYWFVKEMPTEGIEFYLDALGDKLMAMVPQDNEKEALASVYEEFREKVRDKKIRPENVEKMAAAIINLSNSKDTLSADEAEALIEIASVSIISTPQPKFNRLESSAEDWDKLNERLESVHDLDKKLREHRVIIDTIPEMNYRVDENLNVIIDSRVRASMEKEEVMLHLEEQKRVFWIDNMAESLKNDLEKIEVELEAIGIEHDSRKNRLKLKILAQPIIEKGMMIIDSINVISVINWDSLEKEIGREFEPVEEKRILKEEKTQSHIDN